MPRWAVKLFALVGTFVLPLICTVLPYKVSGFISRKGASGKRILSYLMCFGGGIFFGTYLLHMGPEVQTILKDSLLDPHGITYPVAELIVGVGFFTVLFAEKIVLRWNKKRIRAKSKETHHRTHSDINLTVNGVNKCALPPSNETCHECVEGKQCSGESKKIHGHDGVEDTHQKESRSSNVDASSHLLSDPVVIYHVEGSSSAAAAGTDHPGQLQDLSEKEKQANVDDRQKQLTSVECDIETGSLGMHRNHHGGHHHHHATRSLILILALSLHRIFEGMSIGLQQTVASVISLFGAVMCHETVIGFSLGLQFVRSGFALRRLLITSLLCSFIMPLGVLIGLVMTEVESSSGIVDIANGFLQAIAMGTFIYVTFFEILQEEVDSEDTSIGKIVFIAVGFALMALLNLVPEESGTSARPSYSDTTTIVLPFNRTANGCVG